MHLVVCLFALVAAVPVEAPVEIEVHPDTVELEQAGQEQLLNLDFVLVSRSTERLTLGAIQLSVRDRNGKLELRREVNSDGERPSIAVIGAHDLEPGRPELVMNPFQRLDGALDARELVFEFKLYGKEETSVARVSVHPRKISPTLFRLPVGGRVLVYDGSDFYSHHRRFDFVSPTARQLGFRSNVLRHALDLVVVDGSGETHRGDPDRNESWFSFGKPVLAAAAGTVVAVVDSRPDARKLDVALLRTDRMAMFGNYVVVRLASGELALYGHIRQGSARCKVGERVSEGQALAEIGAAGGSAIPHLHFELQTTADADGEGRPVRFRNFRRILGGRSVTVTAARIDTGEIVESAAAPTPR